MNEDVLEYNQMFDALHRVRKYDDVESLKLDTELYLKAVSSGIDTDVFEDDLESLALKAGRRIAAEHSAYL